MWVPRKKKKFDNTGLGVVYCTWHPHIEVSEFDLSPGGPPECVPTCHVGEAYPKVLFWSQTHRTDQEGILISV